MDPAEDNTMTLLDFFWTVLEIELRALHRQAFDLPPSPFCLACFSDRVLCLSWPALDHNPVICVY
jgi:hypothetical protein